MRHDITITIAGSTFPARYEICSHCRGTGAGYLGNRGFVLTQEDFAEDPGLREDLLSGVYDQTCTHCDGSGKVKVPTTRAGHRAEREDYEDRHQEDGLRAMEAWAAGERP